MKEGYLFAASGWRCLAELLLKFEKADDGSIGIFYGWAPLIALLILFTDVAPLSAFDGV